MKIIIEIKGGCAWGVYWHGRRTKKAPEIIVVDLDVGEPSPTHCIPMPLCEASKATRALFK